MSVQIFDFTKMYSLGNVESQFRGNMLIKTNR